MSKNIFVINIHPSFSRKRIPLPTEVGRFLLAVLIEHKKRFVIAGDSVQYGPIYMFGGHRNIKEYRDSMSKLMQYVHDVDIIYASHHELNMKPQAIEELFFCADDILHGRLPAPLDAPAHLPKNVKLYRYGDYSFYLNSERL